MTKKYQKGVTGALWLAVPEQVNVAMGQIAAGRPEAS